MNCVRCSRTIDSPDRNDIVMDFVIALNTFHSSTTTQYRMTYSSTFTADHYLLLSRERVVFCGKCLARRRKLRRTLGLALAAFFVPYILARTTLIRGEMFYVILMVIGFFGELGVILFSSEKPLDFALGHLRSIHCRGKGANIVIFSAERWESMQKT
jgi:hypothetical protein